MSQRGLAALPLAMLVASACAAGGDTVLIPSLDQRLQLPAYWFEAKAPGPRPAVIALHGCGGAFDDKGQLNPIWHRDASQFNAEKMHFLVLDSFTPRGQKSICELQAYQRTIGEEDRREDVFAAIQWLARRPTVDKARIAIMGRSHGAQTVLSVLDRSDRMVKAQSIQPAAGVALYPGCTRFERMFSYELSAPLLLMAGELDDWTPAEMCVRLRDKVQRAQKDSVFELVVFAGAHHGFDGTAPIRLRENIGTTKSRSATVGGNPAAREAAYRQMFEFLAARLHAPLELSHEERLKGHRYVVPPDSGFAPFDQVAAVPLGAQGRSRYEHFLSLQPPKAFVITERGGWFFSSGDRDAMRLALGHCEKAKARCWLYAVDDRVVWSPEAAARIDLGMLREKVSPASNLR